MKRIFVTGAGGFVGARACRFLQGNYEVLTPPKGWMASCTELQLMQSITEAQPDVILHTAAISDTGYTEQHPEEAYRANVELPLWLAHAAAQRGAKLVGFSSDQVYAGVQQPAHCRKRWNSPLPTSTAVRNWKWSNACWMPARTQYCCVQPGCTTCPAMDYPSGATCR